jgi:hypothetical protein
MNAKCNGKKKSGERCGAVALENGLCALHSDPARAVELGRKSGRARRNVRFSTATEDCPALSLRSVGDVTELLAETINQVRTRRIDPRVANTVGYLATGMLKALQQGDIEGRLRAMEVVLSSNKPPSKR